MSLLASLRVKPGTRLRLADIDPASTPGIDKAAPDAGDKAERKLFAETALATSVARIADLQYLLWAENRRALLIVLQGMDTSGKDGVVRHVFSGVNPTGVRVTSFKKPSEIELDHDFLWRIHSATPAKGEIGVFNRSHYEDVLVVRVHGLVEEPVWRKRYDTINVFEQVLADGGTTILKFFLHISKDEQRERLRARLDDPAKNWKFQPSDIEERKRWDDYQAAYEDALSKCSTAAAPWFVVPSDRKWYQRWAIGEIIRETLEAMDPKTPKVTIEKSAFDLK